jgi:hypothetical protein
MRKEGNIELIRNTRRGWVTDYLITATSQKISTFTHPTI